MLTFHVCGRNQGQIVEVAYASAGENVIQRIYDACDQSLAFYISKTLKDDEGDYWQSEPNNKRWRKLTDDEMERYGLEVPVAL